MAHSIQADNRVENNVQKVRPSKEFEPNIALVERKKILNYPYP